MKKRNSGSLTWGFVVGRFLEYEADCVKVSTLYKKRLWLNKYLCFPSGKRISSFDSAYLNSWFSAHVVGSVETKRKCLCVLSDVFRFVSDFYGVDNLAYRRVVIPKDYSIHRVRKEKILSLDEFRLFYSVIDSSYWRDFFLLAFVTGMRFGELRGVTWSEIDFSRKELNVVQQASAFGSGRTEIISPKTASSVRSYSLPSFLVLRLKAREVGSSSPFVFHSFNGDSTIPVGSSTIRRIFSKYISLSGLPHFRFHCFRKSEASFLNDIGISDDDIRDWLGHGSFDVTRKYYLRDSDEKMRRVGEALSQKLAKYFS